VDAQFSEKAFRYFEKAAIMEPHNIEWQLLTAGCQRRSGNFQKALELYRQINRRFPSNIECLKFLVQLCNDLRMPEKAEYEEKLKKLERVNLLRAQRESDSSHNKRAIQNPYSNSSPSSRGFQ
jgi:intraflagellar transport protein 88